MEHVLNSLEAAVLAAGMATAYVADDWKEQGPHEAAAPALPPDAN